MCLRVFVLWQGHGPSAHYIVPEQSPRLYCLCPSLFLGLTKLRIWLVPPGERGEPHHGSTACSAGYIYVIRAPTHQLQASLYPGAWVARFSCLYASARVRACLRVCACWHLHSDTLMFFSRCGGRVRRSGRLSRWSGIPPWHVRYPEPSLMRTPSCGSSQTPSSPPRLHLLNGAAKVRLSQQTTANPSSALHHWWWGIRGIGSTRGQASGLVENSSKQQSLWRGCLSSAGRSSRKIF